MICAPHYILPGYQITEEWMGRVYGICGGRDIVGREMCI
jgi:hypothetical protein